MNERTLIGGALLRGEPDPRRNPNRDQTGLVVGQPDPDSDPGPTVLLGGQPDPDSNPTGARPSGRTSYS